MREPGTRGAPVAQHRRFGYTEQLRDLRNVEPAEESALDHRRLAWADLREVVERRIERDDLGRGRIRLAYRFVERDHRITVTTLRGVPATRSFDEYLPHRARGDALEMKPRRVSDRR